MSKKKPDSEKTAPRKKVTPPQLGWTDWLAKTDAPKGDAPAKPTAPKRNWDKLEFQTPVRAQEEPATRTPAPESTALSEHSVIEEPAALTVTALNKMIRANLESKFQLVWLRAEISNFKSHPSGHFYFSLKDDGAQIQAVMFRGFNSQLRFKPEDGMEVLVRGKITVYEPRGNYQIVCETMEPVGAGALQKAFEQLKRKLEAEGLFAPEKKRPIPLLPQHIAIVTSPTGAAIRDMLNVLGRRYRGARITLVPCVVQGEKAPREIAQAMALANQMKDVDVIIVGRGGGSIEDLWAFNEEVVARAIASSRVPVISAVGHEIDFTIADFVADLRAPTPSAAAELVAKSATELSQTLVRLERALSVATLTRLNRWAEAIRTATRLLIDPRRSIEDAILRCDDLVERMERSIFDTIDRSKLSLDLHFERLEARMTRRVERARERLARGAALLDSVSPLKVLDRGYAVATLNGKVITDASAVAVNSEIEIRLAKGTVHARTQKKEGKSQHGL